MNISAINTSASALLQNIGALTDSLSAVANPESLGDVKALTDVIVAEQAVEASAAALEALNETTERLIDIVA